MRIVVTLIMLIGLSVAIMGQELSLEDGWKNIKVLKTKRVVIEKLFGSPESPDDGNIVYRTGEGNVVVIYSADPCTKTTFGRGDFNLEKDVVIQYQVYLRRPMPIARMKWNKELYKRVEEPHILNAYHIGSAEKGVSFSTLMEADGREYVTGLSYFHTKELGEKFRCRASVQ